MDKFTFNLKNKNTEEILNMTDFDLKNLENLYLIDQCRKIPKCQVIFSRRSNDTYKAFAQNILKIKNTTDISESTAKAEDYADILIKQMKPELKFTFMPASPFKLILGVIEPELFQSVADKWKLKFKQNYSHQIIED